MGKESEARNHLPNPKKWWKDAKGRINPEGLVVNTLISNLSWAAILPAETALSPLVHEVGWDRPDLVLLKFAAIAMLGIAGAKSVSQEAKAFEEKKFSISPPGTLLNAATGMPRLSAVAERVGDHVLLSSVNPFVQAGIVHGDAGLVVDGVIATSIALNTWDLYWNGRIVSGTIDPVVEKLKLAWDGVKNLGSKGEELAGSEAAFTIASAGNLTPGVWVDLPSRNDMEI